MPVADVEELMKRAVVVKLFGSEVEVTRSVEYVISRSCRRWSSTELRYYLGSWRALLVLVASHLLLGPRLRTATV